MSNRSRALRVPHFLIIGAMKSGTTTLYDTLAGVAGFHLPRDKEPDILHVHAEIGDCRRAYDRHFREAPEGAILGEASTAYTQLPTRADISRHAAEVLGPDLKLVMIMRDPVERIISHLRHDSLVGRLGSCNFDEIVRGDPRYIAYSDYALQLAPWVAAFGRENLLCIDFRDLCSDPSEVVLRVARFVGADIVPGGVRPLMSNTRDDLRAARNPVVGRVVGALLYRYGLRRVIGSRVRELGKRLLLARRAPVDVHLSPDTIELVRTELHDMPQRLLQLTGFRLDCPLLVERPAA